MMYKQNYINTQRKYRNSRAGCAKLYVLGLSKDFTTEHVATSERGEAAFGDCWCDELVWD